MELTNEDQEQVAKAIAGDKVDPEKAGPGLGRRQRRQGGRLAPVSDELTQSHRRAPHPRGSPRSPSSRRSRPRSSDRGGRARAPAARLARAAPLRGGQALVVRHAAAPARSRAAARPPDRDRLPLAAAARGRGAATRRWWRWRAARAIPPRAAAWSTPASTGRCCASAGCCWWIKRGTGGSALIDCKRVQSYTGVSSGLAFPRVVAGCARQIARRYGSPDLFATAYAARDLAGGDPGAAARPRRPLRRLLRHVLRPVVHLAPPGPAALGAARLLVSRARPRPLVRVVRHRGALRARRRLRARSGLRRRARARRRAWASCSSGCAGDRSPGARRGAGAGASACARSSTWCRTPARRP